MNPPLQVVFVFNDNKGRGFNIFLSIDEPGCSLSCSWNINSKNARYKNGISSEMLIVCLLEQKKCLAENSKSNMNARCLSFCREKV